MCQDVSVHLRRLSIWILVVVLACAGLGALLGRHIGGGTTGMVVLIGATCAVLGSFLPTVISRLVARGRERQRPRQGAA
jgi:hypothetical protein